VAVIDFAFISGGETSQSSLSTVQLGPAGISRVALNMFRADSISTALNKSFQRRSLISLRSFYLDGMLADSVLRAV
jgi:hypothetical protein